ncbi:MAG: squalene/phytoene synthase family protein [Parvibaculales bacterium]
MQELRGQDGDLYLCHLFVPTRLRSRVLTLYKAYSDISGIPFEVSEPMLGHIRLQWWREMLEDPFKNAADGVPMAQGLVDHPLNVDLMQRLVDSRDLAMSDELTVDQEAAMAGSAFMNLSCEAIEQACDADILENAGKGFELMRLAAADAPIVSEAAILLEDARQTFNQLPRRERVNLIPIFMPIGLARLQARAFPYRKSLLSYHFSLLKMAVTAKI